MKHHKHKHKKHSSDKKDKEKGKDKQHKDITALSCSDSSGPPSPDMGDFLNLSEDFNENLCIAHFSAYVQLTVNT